MFVTRVVLFIILSSRLSSSLKINPTSDVLVSSLEKILIEDFEEEGPFYPINLRDFGSFVEKRLALSFPFFDSADESFAANVFQKFEKFYLPVIRTGNRKCRKAVNEFLPSFSQKLDSWSLKMMDSWGKLPDGLLAGNYHDVGMFEECLKIRGTVSTRREEDISFKGKYCRIFFRKRPADNDKNHHFMSLLHFQYATCMPSVCTDEDLYVTLNETFHGLGSNLTGLKCQEEGDPYHETAFDGFDAFVCSLIGILMVLAVSGTIIEENNLEIYGQGKGKTLLKTVKMFSITRSFRDIFSYQEKKKNSISCLHGIRVITIVWIMVCHQARNMAAFCTNTISAKRLQDNRFSQIVLNAYLAADTFFFISGLLVSYRLFPLFWKAKSETRSNISASMGLAKATWRRLIRLLPAIFMVAVFSATILRFLGWGPNSSELDGYSEICRDTWWKDPIFLTNFFHDREKGVFESDCLHQCWYTSIEMQLFLTLPFVILPLVYNKTIGIMWLSLLTLMSQVIPMLVLIINELPPVLFIYALKKDSYDFLTKYYEAPWCRAGPWFIGIWIGFLLAQNPKCLKKINKLIVIAGYIILSILIYTLIFGLYRYNHMPDYSTIDTSISAIYGFFSGPLWALCVAWTVVTCHINKAKYVNGFLSYWGWQPLSRLSFCMFLVSPVVQKWWYSTQFIPVHCTLFFAGFSTCGTFFLSFVFAFLLSTLVEGPLLRMTKSFASSSNLPEN